MINAAVTDPESGRRFPSTRPLIFGVGSSKFAAGGKGEISVPVNKMAQAMERAYERERKRSGRQVVVAEVSLSLIVCLLSDLDTCHLHHLCSLLLHVVLD